ncbi:MAG: hypothetical protein AAF682_30470 [Planctomycetota bacterium]
MPPAAEQPAWSAFEGSWEVASTALERFERRGHELPLFWGPKRGYLPPPDEVRERYLALRRAVARPSARDERRVLALLVFSGPSTFDEVEQDLGLRAGLAPRLLAPLLDTGCLTLLNGRYRLVERTLPVVLFLLREKLGIDVTGPVERTFA